MDWTRHKKGQSEHHWWKIVSGRMVYLSGLFGEKITLTNEVSDPCSKAKTEVWFDGRPSWNQHFNFSLHQVFSFDKTARHFNSSHWPDGWFHIGDRTVVRSSDCCYCSFKQSANVTRWRKPSQFDVTQICPIHFFLSRWLKFWAPARLILWTRSPTVADKSRREIEFPFCVSILLRRATVNAQRTVRHNLEPAWPL